MRIVHCPACGSEQLHEEALLGVLGILTHYRCRFCGMGFYKEKRKRRVVKSKAKEKQS